MTPEQITALVGQGIIPVLIYILIRQQAQIEKLLAGIVESERQHAKDLVEIVCSGRVSEDQIKQITVTGLDGKQN